MAHRIRIDVLFPSLCIFCLYVSCHLDQSYVVCIALSMSDLPLYNAEYNNYFTLRERAAFHCYFKKFAYIKITRLQHRKIVLYVLHLFQLCLCNHHGTILRMHRIL